MAGWPGLKDDAGLTSRPGEKDDNAAAVKLSGLTDSLKYARSGGQDAYAGAGVANRQCSDCLRLPGRELQPRTAAMSQVFSNINASVVRAPDQGLLCIR